MEDRSVGIYRLLEELGSGGMATVYLATVGEERAGLSAGDTVAVKVLHKHLVEESNFFERFRREAEIGSNLEHKNIVRTYDFGVADDGGDDNYLVMEYVEGQTLRRLVEEMGRLPEDLCRHIAREILSAMVAIHAAGIVHRDIKPENIIITSDDVVKVMDLGVAFLADEAIRLSMTGQFVGSIFYAAPEQIQGGGKEIDHRVDLHQLGVLLYELASGIHPYRDSDLRTVMRRLLMEDARPLSSVNPQTSPFFEELVRKLMEKDRDLRFATAAEALEALTDGEESAWWVRRSQEIRDLTNRPLRRVRIPRETALYGREVEMDRLVGLWDRVAEGEGQAILIEGEAGIGKTRLLDEFCESVERETDDVHLLFGAYTKGQAGTVSGGFSTAYREHFGAEQLEEQLGRYVTVSKLLIPAFAALLKGDAPPEGEEPLTKESLQTVFVDVTRALSTEKPTVVVIEDLHFATEEARGLFAALAHAIADQRVLLIGTSRRGLDRKWVGNLERGERFHRMVLPRLDLADLRRLLRDSLGSGRLAETLVPQIAAKSDGKPFYVFEILRGLREGQFLGLRPDGTWVTTREIREIHVPSSIRDLILSRLDGLGEDDRALLEMAACSGFEFEPGLLAPALGLGRIPMLKRLGLLEKTSRIVRSVGRKYAFDEHQIQEALYEAMAPERRQENHVALACAREDRLGGPDCDPAELDGPVAVDICNHFLRGGCPDRALRYLQPALDHLASGYLNASVVELAALALKAGDLIGGEDRLGVLLRKAVHLDLLGWRVEEKMVLQEALDLKEESGITSPRTLRLLGAHCRAVSDYAAAAKHLRAAAQEARSAGDRSEESEAMADLGLVSYRLGLLHEARGQLETAVELAREAGDARMEGIHRGNLGLVDFGLGRYATAAERHREAISAARDAGDSRNEGIHTSHLANVLWAQGLYAEAMAHYEMALETARLVGDRRLEGVEYLNLGLIEPILGRPGEGRKLLEEARAIFSQVGYREGEASALQGIGTIAEDGGRIEEAETLYGESLVIRREIGAQSGVAESLLSLGRIHTLQERKGAAQGDFLEALNIAQELDRPAVIVLAAGYLALLARGDEKFARQVLEDHADRLGTHARMEANLILYMALKEERHLEEAADLLDELLQHAPAERRVQMRENVSLHRQILAARAS